MEGSLQVRSEGSPAGRPRSVFVTLRQQQIKLGLAVGAPELVQKGGMRLLSR